MLVFASQQIKVGSIKLDLCFDFSWTIYDTLMARDDKYKHFRPDRDDLSIQRLKLPIDYYCRIK